MTASLELPNSRDVIGLLQTVRQEMAAAVRDLGEADEIVVMAKEAEEIAVARILIRLGDDGTVSEREAIAKVETESLRFTRIVGQQQYRAAKRRLDEAEAGLRAIQSINSAVNTEWRTQAMGQPG